jgi:HSP20 family molecular chaperone IbpA
VELPGIDATEDPKLTWTNSRTLLIEAKIKPSQGQTHHPRTEEVENEHNKTDQDQPVHVLVKERPTGTLARAFDFSVDVNHDTMTATMKNGLLALVLEKGSEEQAKRTEIQVQHDGP